MTIAILVTGTTTAIVTTGTTIAEVVTGAPVVVEDGGGSGGTSRSTGVSLVDAQINATPPKKRLHLSTELRIHSKLVVPYIEKAFRVGSTLRALMAEGGALTLNSKVVETLQKKFTVRSDISEPMSGRLEMHGNLQVKLQTKLHVAGEKDYSDVDTLIRLSGVLQKRS